MRIRNRQIRNAHNLDELLAALRAHGNELNCREMTHLPTFVGEEPSNTSGVWSWDESRLLVGTCASDLRIEDR